MENSDLFKYTEQFPAEFAGAATFAGFAASLDGSKPGVGKLLQHIADKYPNAWEAAFQTIKTHGFTGRALELPHAKTVREIFASVSLFPYERGGKYRSEYQYVRAGAAFVSAHRAAGFGYFGRLGADYHWSPEWLKRGQKVRSIRGGDEWLTAAIPTPAVVQAFGAIAGPGDWELATFEAVRWEDGRTLIIGRSSNGFGNRWLCLLDAGETALSLLDDHERGEIAAELERQREAWGE